jgi:hypothetical protein
MNKLDDASTQHAQTLRPHMRSQHRIEVNEFQFEFAFRVCGIRITRFQERPVYKDRDEQGFETCRAVDLQHLTPPTRGTFSGNALAELPPLFTLIPPVLSLLLR